MKEKNPKKGNVLEGEVQTPQPEIETEVEIEEIEKNEETGTTESSTQKGKSKHLKELILLLVAVICIATGVFLLLRRPVTEIIRTEEAVTIIEKIEAGAETIIVKSDEFVIEGEGYEIFDDVIDYQAPEQAETTLPEEVVLTAAGTIQIEAIDLNLPLWDDAGVVPLRYGAGILVDSVLPGEEGNLVILGHRMKTYGSLFNRLSEMKIGDEVIIETIDGVRYVYIVDEIQSAIKPKELPNYIKQSDDDGIRLTLVTCTPAGVGTHRLIVIAHLAE